ncbi:MAG: class I SAM-dependent methyltransferase [Ignavibacteriae bacterium]|nr:class I SAM-dependent methyltransferase [Ignavibacteriota bacterium]MCB9243577.1 class I SAM-dependent methyltransferase [Ignavibacteriales bacterium]
MEIKKNWQEDFFIDGWDKFQDAYLAPERAIEETNFIDEFAKERGYKKVLDIPCGTGRISIPVAQRGYEVTGIDFNPNAVRIARERSSGMNIEFVEGDMREISYREEFDLITCMWGSLGYFSDEENFNFFCSLYKALRPGGAAVFDTLTLESIMRIYSPTDTRKMEGGYLIEERKYDARNSRINVEWIFLRGKEELKVHSSIRIYTYKEHIDMLEKAGFTEFRSFGGFKGEEFTVNSRRLELIAIK